jgi:hypothetical protein
MGREGTNDANIQPSPPVGLCACLLLREAKEVPLIRTTAVAAPRAWRVEHSHDKSAA